MEQFIADGGHVHLISGNKKKIEIASKRLELSPAQISFVDSLQDDVAMANAFAALPRIDHLVCTSGIGHIAPFVDCTMEQLFSTWTSKYWTYIRAVRSALPVLNRHGSITFIGGNFACKPHPGWSQMAAVNAALEGLARALALELAPVRVNVVAPGTIETPLWKELLPDFEQRATAKARIVDRLPVGTVGHPDEVARFVNALIKSPFSSGEVIRINGGENLV